MNVTEENLQRERIRNVIYNYCRAIDERRFDDVMKSFSVDATIKHGSYNGAAKDFIGFLSNVLNKMDVTLHNLGGIIVTFEGNDLAHSHATFSSFHRMSGDHAQVGPVVTNGVETDWIVAGRYRDTLRLIKGEWKIIDRIGSTDWDRVEPSVRA
ncbi:MAG: nuclear transport factor 2 family protein [Litorimonas sp.]